MTAPLRQRVSWLMTLGLTIIWIMLWGDWSPGAAVFGVLIALGIQLAFPMPVVPEIHRIRPIGAIVLVATTLWGLLIASLQIAWQIVAFWRPTRHAIIVVPLRNGTDFITALTAELVTLVPGSIVVDATPGELTVHVFHAFDDDDIQHARDKVLEAERRVAGAFGTRAERSRCEEQA